MLTLCLAARAPAAPLAAQSDTTLTVTITVALPEDRSIRQARELGEQEALLEAARQLRATVSGGTIRAQSEVGEKVQDLFYQLVAIESEGIPVRRRLVQERTGEIPLEGRLDKVYRATWEVVMARSGVREDPAFRAELSLNDPDGVYVYHGDDARDQELVARVTSTQDGYLTLIEIDADTVQVILPNAGTGDLPVSARTPTEFPSAEQRRAGAKFLVSLDPGRNDVPATLMAVVTKRPIPFAIRAPAGRVTTLASLDALMGWLARIPRDQRATALATFRTVRAK
ncbi:MAG: DUF4384 domain-containing protein [Gemmatimonadales bacterium]|nr:DUF4384 domain-containing protein [Gemmatimonadales bacterium]